MAINDLNIGNRPHSHSNGQVLPYSNNVVYKYNFKNGITSDNFNLKQQPSFEGKSFKLIEPVIYSSELVQRTIKLTNEISDVTSVIRDGKRVNLYEDYIKTFNDKVINDKNFRKKLHIDDKSLEIIKNGGYIGIPRKNALYRFMDEFLRPVRWLARKFSSKEKRAKLDKENDIVKNFANVQELLDSILGRNKKLADEYKINKDGLVISDKALKEKIIRKRSSDIKNENYPVKILSSSNRLVSGAVSAVFLGIDAFNTTMLLTKDKNKSDNESVTRFMQEAGRLAITVYAGDLIMGTFKRESERSLKAALAVAGASVLIAEVSGRWLVGKPILPSSKEKIDKLEQKSKERTGIHAAIANVLSGELLIKKPHENAVMANSSAVSTANNKSLRNAMNKNTTNNFTSRPVNPPAVSFKGNFQEIVLGKPALKYVNVGYLTDSLEVFKEIDPPLAAWYKNKVIKCLKKTVLKDKDIQEKLVKAGINIETLPSSEYSNKFDEIIGVFDRNKDLPLGKKEHKWHRVLRSFFAPLYWIYDGINWVSKSIKNYKFNHMSIKEKIKHTEDILRKKGLMGEFNEMMKSPEAVYIKKNSSLSQDEIKLKMMQEVQKIKGEKLMENIDGVLNAVDWLNKMTSKSFKMTTKEFLAGRKQNKYDEELDVLKKELFKSFKKIDGKTERGYKKSVFTVWNYPVTKGVSTFFIVSDIYNLSMLHSNGDKEVSKENAKDRTNQELSRIFWSQYIIGLTQDGLFKNLYDRFLWAAIGTVALNGIMRETISRSVVNVPIVPKSYDDLVENQKKGHKTNSFLAKVMGKKVSNNSSQVQSAVSLSTAPKINNNHSRVSIQPFQNALVQPHQDQLFIKFANAENQK